MNSNAPLISPKLVQQLVDIARQAGAAIMDIYQQKDSYQLRCKTDSSPLTAADLAAHHLITAALPDVLSLPILSEEGEQPGYEQRQWWTSYWLVDPLDGTKEFIAGNGEFTVNIALVHHGRPVLGIVHVPVANVTYVGSEAGAWKYSGGDDPIAIRTRSLKLRFDQGLPLTVLSSHRHGNHEVIHLMDKIALQWRGPIEVINRGSSLKFCVIAEGLADFYPRLMPTSEWDTAAAQAVLDAAGGRVIQLPSEREKSFTSLAYNAKSSLLNPHFYALGDQQFMGPILSRSTLEDI